MEDELFIVYLEGAKPAWRIYTTLGRASAALELALNTAGAHRAVGGKIFTVSTADLQVSDTRGTLDTIDQDTLF